MYQTDNQKKSDLEWIIKSSLTVQGHYVLVQILLLEGSINSDNNSGD